MKIVQQHLDYDNLYEFLHSSKKIRMSKDESIKEKYYNSFPKMKSRASFELLLDLLHDFEYDDINKDISGKSFINLVTIDGKPFKEQLLRISSNSFVNMDSSHELLEEKRNIKSMPMRIDSFQNIDLNYPLIPDNNDYSKILTYFSSSTIIDIFNGILLEEKILIVTDLIENFASIVESFNELLFPFNPNNYFTISFITEDMIDFLYAPVPYIIGWDSETFKSIQKFHWKHLESEIMWIQPSKNKILWQRKVRYPQPHTKYLWNTLETLMKNRNRFLIKGGLNKSLNQWESDLMHSLIGFIETNLRIKQAFLNFILILLNNFLAFNSYSIYLTSKLWDLKFRFK